VKLRIIDELQAGFESDKTVGPGEAIRIMTGAPIPGGADSVVMVELTERDDDSEVSILQSVPEGEAVRLAGEDVEAGERVFEPGAYLQAASSAMLASIGRAHVYVHRRPRVAILSTGEELVEVGQEPKVGQIFNSNSYALEAQVREAGGEPLLLGIARDNAEDLERHLRDGLAADVVLTSGGVSVGDFDLVKDTLGDLGNEMHFWRVRMKPGKPMAFGMLQGRPVFGLPGNPVSTMVSFELFVRPTLMKMQGHSAIHRPVVSARLLHALSKSPERRHYVRARAVYEGEGWSVNAVEAQGSNIIHSMVRANSMIIFPEYETELEAESQVRVLLLDSGSALLGGLSSGEGPGALMAKVEGGRG
ncbi:MAG: molybdopterin molybdotransferase MoeA, partial [Nitrospinaceae bacterium]|nr:molybdopterin molybdotransferase MoeA [Nitrospinaceae bacterium]